MIATKSICRIIVASTFLSASCGKKKTDDEKKFTVDVRAQGLLSIDSSVSLARMALDIPDPADETNGYPGIGINSGESVVDGLKIKLTGVSLGGIPGSNSGGRELLVFDWSASPKEISIEDGLSEKLQQSVELPATEATYHTMTVRMLNTFSVKAYAYLDSDNNGTIDTTIYTTPSEVKKVEQKLSKSELTDYGFFEYKFALTSVANAVNDSGNIIGNITVFPAPVTITSDNTIRTTNPDGKSNEKLSSNLSVDLAIDTYRIVKAWDGRYGNTSEYVRGDSSKIPHLPYPFPNAEDTRMLRNGLKSVDFFPAGKPAFGMGDYIPMYAFPNSSGLKAKVYLVAKDSTFSPFNSQVMTIVSDSSDVPLIGKFSLGENIQTLRIGPAARLFEKQGSGKYNFATSFGEKNENGTFDGGLYYSNDVAKAGHLFEGLDLALPVGGSSTLTMKNGNRCRGEYNNCVDPNGITAHYLRVK